VRYGALAAAALKYCNYVINQLKYLDRLRAIAVIGVLVVHTSQFAFANLSDSGSSGLAIGTLLSAGRFGVEVFFLLSGFLLSYLYEAPGKPKSNKQFFLARFFRIWPLWIIFSGIWSLVYLLANSEVSEVFEPDWVLTGFILSSVFLLWLSPEHYGSFIGGAWSIQIEVFSYVIFAAMRNLSVNRILVLATFVNLLGLALVFIGDMEGFGILDALRRLSFQTGFNFFVLGWLLARVFTHHDLLSKSPEAMKSSVLESFTFVFANHSVVLSAWILSFLLSPAFHGNTIEAIGFVALALVFAQLSGRSSLISRLLERTGKLSYFMFFMHFVLLYALDLAIPSESRPSSLALVLAFDSVAIPIIFVACYIPAIFSLKFFEAPLMSFARKLGSGGKGKGDRLN
jgi:peptidoglycan/LPS O-acetylase OafA/YrhL